MGFWPTTLKQILEIAVDNQSKPAQKWFQYRSKLDDVYIERKDGDLQPADNNIQEFKKSITSIVNLL